MAAEKAWLKAFNTGSKSLQDRLRKVHAKNPEFQSFLGKHGFEGGSSVKQASKAQTVSKEVAAKRTELSNKAYGATTGAKMGGEHGSNDEYKDTTVPLTKDQHSKVQVAKKAALSKDERMALIVRAAKKHKRGDRFEVPTEDPDDAGHDDMMDLHHSLHIGHGSVDEAKAVVSTNKPVGYTITDAGSGKVEKSGTLTPDDLPKTKTVMHKGEKVTIPAHKAPKSGFNKFGKFATLDKVPVKEEAEQIEEVSLAADIQRDVDARNKRLADAAAKAKKKKAAEAKAASAAKQAKEMEKLKNLSKYGSDEEKEYAKGELQRIKNLEEANFKYDVDHMPGQTVRGTLPKSCPTCYGRKSMYKTPEGKMYADKKTEDSKRVACPDCEGKGYVAEGIDPNDVIKFGANFAAYEYGIKPAIDHIVKPAIKAAREKIKDKLVKKADMPSQQVAEAKDLSKDLKKGVEKATGGKKTLVRDKKGVLVARNAKSGVPESEYKKPYYNRFDEEAERSQYLNSKISEARQQILNKLADKTGKK